MDCTHTTKPRFHLGKVVQKRQLIIVRPFDIRDQINAEGKLVVHHKTNNEQMPVVLHHLPPIMSPALYSFQIINVPSTYHHHVRIPQMLLHLRVSPRPPTVITSEGARVADEVAPPLVRHYLRTPRHLHAPVPRVSAGEDDFVEQPFGGHVSGDDLVASAFGAVFDLLVAGLAARVAVYAHLDRRLHYVKANAALEVGC